MDWQTQLDLAVRAAKAAGDLLRDALTKDKAVLKMMDRDIKLQADRDAEACILGILGESAYPVLAEESGEHGNIDAGTPAWIVDPLDGTMNFSRGLPLCCVSIALCRKNEPFLGVIHDFSRDECFTGVVGEGAWLNDAPMSVSSIDTMCDAILATGFPVSLNMESDTLRDFLQRAQSFKKVRMLGTAALMMAYVACGRVDAYAEQGTMFWDVAAGVAIVRAAGGYAELTDSEQKKWGKNICCASNESVWTA